MPYTVNPVYAVLVTFNTVSKCLGVFRLQAQAIECCRIAKAAAVYSDVRISCVSLT